MKIRRRLLLICLLALLLPAPSFAVLSAADVWEVRASGASDNNGGAFKAAASGTDRSQQNAAQVAIDNAAITTSIAANVITFTGGYSPSSADVGNVVHMLTGTNVTAGWYEITSEVAGTSWTVTGAATLPTSGTTTNATGNMGGALATLGTLAGAMVASNKAYCTGAFTSTATTTFAQTVAAPAPATPPTRLIGYGAARGDNTHATLALQTNTGLTGINATGAGFWVEKIDVDCGSLGTSTGIALLTLSVCRYCKAANFTAAGITVTTSSQISDCELTGGGSAATMAISCTGAVPVIRNWVHDNACPGIIVTSNANVNSNIVANNTGASSDGIRFGVTSEILNNTCHNNGRDGIRSTVLDMAGVKVRNNIVTSNGGWGITGSSSTALPADDNWDGNVYWNNTSGARNLMDSTTGIFGVNPYTNVRDVTLTGSPYVGPTTGSTANFALNDVPGAGRACRRAGSPSTWYGNTGTTSYPDMGAVQTRSNIRLPRP